MKMGNFGTDMTGNLGTRVVIKIFAKYIVKKKLRIEITSKIVLNKQYLLKSWSSFQKVWTTKVDQQFN